MIVTAVIFDLDGTVLDNEGQWETAFRAVFDRYNLAIDQVMKQPGGWVHEPGIGIEPNWKRVCESLKLSREAIESLTRETVDEYKSRVLGPKDIFVREGVEEIIELAKERGWLTALCTGSDWVVVEQELEQLGLYLAFDITTTGEEVLMQKPDPEIFNMTAQKLGVEPAECIIVEDAVAGVRAAVEGGYTVIAIKSEYAPEELLFTAGAHYVVENMSDAGEILKKAKNEPAIDSNE